MKHDYEQSDAIFGPDPNDGHPVPRTYRYALYRRWGPGTTAAWIGLNPSTADETDDDPTIRRIVDFSRRWGHGAAVMLNLFAYRTTRPVHLREFHDPVGPMNDTHIINHAVRADRVVAAWGTNGDVLERDQEVLTHLRGLPIWMLGATKHGHPKHPLYVKAETVPVRLYPVPLFDAEPNRD